MNKPLMSQADADTIIETLRNQVMLMSKYGRPMLWCLEWGAGGSTIHFQNFLAENNVPFHWHSLEHNAEWYENVTREIGPNLAVELTLFPSKCPKEEPMDTYVNHPLGLGRRFNFIFVDGRHRRRCLITASKLLAVGGVVVLHDAKREYYHSAFEHFTSHWFAGDDLWIGRIDAK